MTTEPNVTTAPYTPSGNLMRHPENHAATAPDWRPNVPFAATLRLDGTRRRFADRVEYFVWLDEASREFPMSVPDLADLIRSGNVIAGNAIAGLWMATQRDGNFGVRLAADDEIAAFSGSTDSMGM